MNLRKKYEDRGDGAVLRLRSLMYGEPVPLRSCTMPTFASELRCGGMYEMAESESGQFGGA